MEKLIPGVCILALMGAAVGGKALAGQYDYLNQAMVPLSAKERKALRISSSWSNKNDIQPYMTTGGKLMYVHGASVPTIIASPFQVCDVELERGESVNEIVLGDSARWLAEAGTAGNTTHLFIKPADAGLQTSAVITTDRRVYHLRLISRLKGYTPYVGFTYFDALRRDQQQKQSAASRQKEWSSTVGNDGKEIDLAQLNFNYEVEGKVLWKPERVYDDGLKTYIKLPKSTRSGEMPALLVRKGGTDVLVNYRVQNETMIVDGLFNTIALVAGVGGDQECVEIRRGK
nr:P-type conjugative transfer protein TrbG [uncultured Desulfobulbus sp.]